MLRLARVPFSAKTGDGVNALVQNILAPVTGLLQTAEELVDEEALNKILSGLTKDVEALKSIFGDEGLTLTGIKNIAGNRGDALVAIVNNLLAGIEITDKNGNKVELANLLPETFFLDISKIAIEELTGPAADQAWNKSTATVYETNVETWDVNVASLLMYVLQTALSDDIIELLAGLIGADLAGDDLVAEIFNTLLDSDNAQDLILDVIIGLFNGYDVAYVPVNGKLIQTGTHFDKHENCEIADREDDINALTGNIDRLINKAIPEVFNLLEEMGTIDNMEAGALKDILLQIAADEDATVASALDLLLNSFVFTADIATTVGKALIGLLGSGDLASVDHFLQLQTGSDTNQVSAFVDRSESVVEVVQLFGVSHGTGGVAELDFGILFSSQNHVGLMTVGVGDDQVAALAHEVQRGVIAGLIFRNLVLPDDLVVGDAEVLCGFLDTVHVCLGVTFGFVTDEDYANLEVSGCTAGAAGECSGDGYHHQDCENDCRNFLEHESVPPKLLCYFIFHAGMLPALKSGLSKPIVWSYKVEK